MSDDASSEHVNDELVSQFMAFTGSADPARAASYLEMSHGNLETAVGLYMEHESGGGGGGRSGDDSDVASRASALRHSLQHHGDDDVRAPDATRTMRLMDDGSHMLHPAAGGSGAAGMMQMMMGGVDPTSFQLMNAMMEEQLADVARMSAPSAFRSSSVPDARAAVNRAAAAAAESKHSSDNDDDDSYNADDAMGGDDDDEDDDVQVWEASGPAPPPTLEDMFAPPVHLMHKAGGFNGARTMAKDTRRWLLVNIQRDNEFASHALNRDVWRDELVENLLREGFIFWQQFDVSPEGLTYVQRYKVNDYPHIGIIDPRTGRLLWRKEGWTQQNPLTAESFAEMAMDFCSRNSFDRPPQAPRPGSSSSAGAATAAADASARPASNKRPMHQMSEDEQLQAAMAASMEDVVCTSPKDNGDLDGDDNGNHKSVEVIDADVEDEENNEKKPPARQDAQQPSLHAELLTIAVAPEPAAGPRIQLRFPDGKRLVRKFPGDCVVKTIYAFVAQSIEDAQKGREFVLLAGFPPTDLLPDLDKTVDECKLGGQTVAVRWKDSL